ncbi:hypothetical protein E8E13_004933 [Curvularia kusanoi]|uniref:Uncharacterized protein n=1 Tax=Curvularia kusanoi TaxID=90978 RepID=A0A9P4TAB0_CURKU|nr:hypothetical protein E8E13_004933 [Curvularia kusanoi]
MNRLRTKTSRLFNNSPHQEEVAADANISNETACDATPVRSLRKKPSRFFRRKVDEMTPPATPTPSLSQETQLLHSSSASDTIHNTVHEMPTSVPPDFENIEANMPPASVPIYTWSPSPTKAVADKETTAMSSPSKQAELLVRKKPSLPSLRNKAGLRFSRGSQADDDCPKPPVPQIPVAPLTPQAPRPVIISLLSGRSKRPTPSSTPELKISSPVATTQLGQLPSTVNTPKFPFTKPPGPPPPRPPRPHSIDEELLGLLRDNSTRKVLLKTNRTSTSTISTESSIPSTVALPSGYSSTVSLPSGCSSTVRIPSGNYSIVPLPSGHSSIVPIPSGHSSFSPPRMPVSPLAANFPQDANRPLPIRTSNGSVLGFGRFSAFVRASGGYPDGVDPEDRELGPIELYREEKCVDWALIKRDSGKLGQRGMMFKDRWGGLHFVLDI